MDELENEVLKRELCTQIEEKIMVVKNNISKLQDILKTYNSDKKILLETAELLRDSKRNYEQAKEEYRETLQGNIGNQKQQSLSEIIGAVTRELSEVELEMIPNLTTRINSISAKIEYYDTNVNHVNQLINLGQLTQLQVTELEEELRKVTKLYEEVVVDANELVN